MPLSGTPAPGQHSAAREFLEGLTAVTADEVRELTSRARLNAFWMGHVNDLTLVQDVLDQIGDQIIGPEGNTFGLFQEQLLDRLEREWAGRVGDPPMRLELITRNLTQRAYNGGRWAQMQKPETVRRTPYLIYDTIDDDRRSEMCAARAGTILPVDHEWWRRNWPPIHHFCRSIVRALSQRRVDRLGGVSEVPVLSEELEPKGSFGLTPDQAEPLRPEEGDYDSRLYEAALEKGMAEPPLPTEQ